MDVALTLYLVNTLVEGMMTLLLNTHFLFFFFTYVFTLCCSNQVDDEIEYAILTRNIYDVCGIESEGFCNGVCIYIQHVFNWLGM